MTKVKALWVLMCCLLVTGGGTIPVAAANPGTQPAVTQYLFRFDVMAGNEAMVALQETRIMVQTHNLPPVQVSSLNLPLLREWSQIYFKVDDYDRDGMNDLAILQSVGRVGTERCYGIYRYDPATGRFRPQKSFDRCGI